MSKPQTFRFSLDPDQHGALAKLLIENGKVRRYKSRVFLSKVELYAKYNCMNVDLFHCPEYFSKPQEQLEDFKLTIREEVYPAVYKLIVSAPYSLKSLVATNLALNTYEVIENNPALLNSLKTEDDKKKKLSSNSASPSPAEVSPQGKDMQEEEAASGAEDGPLDGKPPLMDVKYLESETTDFVIAEAEKVLDDLADNVMEMF